MIVSTPRAVSHTVTLQASTTENGTDEGGASHPMPDAPSGMVFILDVTAAATAAGDKLDVFVQTLPTSVLTDDFVDIVHFTQVAGNGGAKRYIAKVTGAVNTAEFETGAALGAGAVRNLLGNRYLVRWVVTDVDTPNFTFSVVAIPM